MFQDTEFPSSLIIIGLIALILACGLCACGGGDPEDFPQGGDNERQHIPAQPSREQSK